MQTIYMDVDVFVINPEIVRPLLKIGRRILVQERTVEAFQEAYIDAETNEIKTRPWTKEKPMDGY
jgi:hypothetical protein